MIRGNVLWVLALALVGCGNQGAKQSHISTETAVGIVNGTDVTQPDLYSRHTVFLQMISPEGSAVCTGSILDEETILTAAHCLAGAKQAAVVFATNVQNSKNLKPEQIRVVDIMALYPKYSTEEDSSERDESAPAEKAPVGPPPIPTVEQVEEMLEAGNEVDYDVAMVHFQGGLPAGYTPVRLATSAAIVQPGARLHMIGFGLAKVNSKVKVVDGQPILVAVPDQSTVGQLRETELPIAKYNTKVGMILTDGRQSSVCSGDSGGPAFLEDPATGEAVQVGIAEAVANSYCNSVAMHTAVFPYLDWIEKTAAKMKAKTDRVAEAQLAN